MAQKKQNELHSSKESINFDELVQIEIYRKW